MHNKRQLEDLGGLLGDSGSSSGGKNKKEEHHIVNKKPSATEKKSKGKSEENRSSSGRKDFKENARGNGKSKQKHDGDKRARDLGMEVRHYDDSKYRYYADERGAFDPYTEEHGAAEVHIHEHVHKRDHSGHWYPHNGHSHDHVHVHVNKRDEHSGHWYEHHDSGRHLDEHVHSHRRDLIASGVPGFVEVASTLFHSNLAKSMAGLVFSKDPEANSSDFTLGTSDSQSTQFYLAPYQDPAAAPYGVTENDVTNATFTTDPESSVPAYQLRIPVLDSQSLTTNDYCATFDVKPPSPLSMQPCGEIDGFSQVFGYNATTGELVPVYPASATQPLPLNAAVKIGNPQEMDAVVGTNSTSSDLAQATGTVGDDTNSTVSSSGWASFMPSSSLPAPTPVSTGAVSNDASAAPKVSLYFVPSSGFYSDVSLKHLKDT